MSRTAFVTIAGRTNAGKSSLLNAMIGEKIASVSSKPQTTRSRLMGVMNREGVQIVLVDTPGVNRPRTRLGEYMVNVVQESVTDVDAVLFLVEPLPEAGPGEVALIERFRESGVPVVLVINKIDTVEVPQLLKVIAAYSALYDFEAVIPVSAKTGDGLPELLAEMDKLAVEGPHLFPDDEITDQPERQICAELIREKILLNLEKEIPHGTAVEITKFSERESGILDIDATIYCEKASHKGILIGKNGAMLRKIGSEARADMEAFLGAKVFLQTWIKVKENWRDSDVMLRNFGYRND